MSRRDLPDTWPPSGSVWLPGDVEVDVAGEAFHVDGVRAVERAERSGEALVAVLVPEDDNPHDADAVAVHVQRRHVGYLAAAVAARVRSALVAFTAAHGGSVVACPATVRWSGVGPQVVLLLAPEPLGVGGETFETVPELAATLARLLTQLDAPEPVFGGVDVPGRSDLATAETALANVEATDAYERHRNAWPRVEKAFRDVTGRLERAGDPLVARGWLGTARATRYQRGRRDDVVAALVHAVRCGRADAEAWHELVEYASLAPHVPTLVSLFSRAPLEVRPGLLGQLMTMSYGRDRHGKLDASRGARLRAALMDAAEAQHDRVSVGTLAGDIGVRAEKAGDLDAAVDVWRRAVAAGSSDEKVADRFSIWLVKRGEYAEAAQVLRHALTVVSPATSVRERMRRRLDRCERARRKRRPAS